MNCFSNLLAPSVHYHMHVPRRKVARASSTTYRLYFSIPLRPRISFRGKIHPSQPSVCGMFVQLCRSSSYRKAFVDLSRAVRDKEIELLNQLGFQTRFALPYKYLINYLQAMGKTDVECFQKAWNYLNDSFMTRVNVEYSVTTVAAAAIYLFAIEDKVALPSRWMDVFEVDKDTVTECAAKIQKVYQKKFDKKEYAQLMCDIESFRYGREARSSSSLEFV